MFNEKTKSISIDVGSYNDVIGQTVHMEIMMLVSKINEYLGR